MRFIIGGVVGFGSAYAILHFRDMNMSEYIFVYVALAVVAGLLIWSVSSYREVKRIYHTTYTGEEEDEADQRKYQKSSDFTVAFHSAIVLAMITVAVTLIQKTSIALIIAAMIVLVASLIVGSFMNKISEYLYPDRELPKADSEKSGDEYLDAMLEMADEGERFIILQGLYKSHNLLNILLIGGIILATTYSVFGESSQLFSIIMMGVVLIAGNVKYQRSIRNK